MQKSINPSHAGHRQRLKQRLRTVGADSLLDHEFLELLLTYAIARKDTKPLAWALLKRFGSLANVLDAGELALKDIPGIGPNTALFLQLIRSAHKRYARARIPKRVELNTPQKVLDYCQASLAGKQEEFLEVIFLSIRGTILSTRIMGTGSITQICVEPRQIVKEALKVNASALIIVHNHPSGDTTPSQEDLLWTLKTKEAAWLFGIKLFDHLIVSKDSYYSFNKSGYLTYPNPK